MNFDLSYFQHSVGLWGLNPTISQGISVYINSDSVCIFKVNVWEEKRKKESNGYGFPHRLQSGLKINNLKITQIIEI